MAGVAVLAPDPNLFWGGGAGLDRTDGEAHAQIVNDLVQQVLPQVLAFDANRVSFTGVSGGSLLLSGFFMPAFMQNFADPVDAAAAAAAAATGDASVGGNATAGVGVGVGAGAGAGAHGRGRGRGRLALSPRQANNNNNNTGTGTGTSTSTSQKQGQVLLNCGALPPQVSVSAASAAALANTRVHFQSTQAELAELQDAIPAAVAAYEQVVAAAGLTAAAAQVGALQTVDNSPNGGHCEFDEQDFVSGVQLMADSFSAVMQGGDGLLAGTNVNVLNPVPGHEKLVFSGGS